MTDETTTNENEQPSGPPELRAALDRKTEEAKKYRGLLMQSAFSSLGFDPSKGLGKAIAKEFDGEPTVEAISAYAAEEYGWEPPSKEETPPVQPTPQQAIQQPAQQRVDQAIQQSTPANANTLDQQIQDAEAKGDWITAMSLKTQKLTESLN